jgi:hypothetical protein
MLLLGGGGDSRTQTQENILGHPSFVWSRDSSVGTATRLWGGVSRNRDSMTGSGAHAVSIQGGTGGCFLGGKAAGA